ncbi:MAG: hypothetical protein NTX86_01985 [Candidatus Dependentiae bacterium]|nr:hypothetical protein [Candidatus Dependentiae bacterium]
MKKQIMIATLLLIAQSARCMVPFLEGIRNDVDSVNILRRKFHHCVEGAACFSCGLWMISPPSIPLTVVASSICCANTAAKIYENNEPCDSMSECCTSLESTNAALCLYATGTFSLYGYSMPVGEACLMAGLVNVYRAAWEGEFNDCLSCCESSGSATLPVPPALAMAARVPAGDRNLSRVPAGDRNLSNDDQV